jgi:hypothetical protein
MWSVPVGRCVARENTRIGKVIVIVVIVILVVIPRHFGSSACLRAKLL